MSVIRWCQLISSVVGCVLVTSVLSADCQSSTPTIDAMVQATVRVNGEDNHTISVSVADSATKRAAGFQYVCEARIQKTAILFVFDAPLRPSFHMRNVLAPLDIAFIDGNGQIVDIQTMHTYILGSLQRPTYAPPMPVIAALETRAGYFDDHNIEVGDVLNWALPQ